MNSKILVSFVVFGFLFNCACVKSYLICYDCDPTNTHPNGDCSKPAETNVRNALCSQSVVNGTPICVSIYMIPPSPASVDGNFTGIYRGCSVLPQDVQDFCDWYILETHSKTTIKSCVACSNTRCNTHAFKDDGTIDTE